LFDLAEFENNLGTRWLGTQFLYLKETDSTNTFLKNLEHTRFVNGTVVLADDQTGGRGQHGRVWKSAPECNLTFTMGFKPKNGDRLTLLTLSAALALKYTIQKYTTTEIAIKWPNDLLCKGKKIAGLLTECVFCGDEVTRVLLGIGLNVFQKKFGTDLESSAVSLAQVTDSMPSREILLSEFLQQMEFMYKRWHKYDPNLHIEINRNLKGYGKWVRLEINGNEKAGEVKFCGVNEKGYLVVLNEDLEARIFTHEQVRIGTINRGV